VCNDVVAQLRKASAHHAIVGSAGATKSGIDASALVGGHCGGNSNNPFSESLLGPEEEARLHPEVDSDYACKSFYIRVHLSDGLGITKQMARQQNRRT